MYGVYLMIDFIVLIGLLTYFGESEVVVNRFLDTV
jgi:hypothetical protein